MNRVQEITQLHNANIGALRTSVETAIRIGGLLVEQKAELVHGNWQQWVAKNLPFSIRTATNYMKIFEDRARLKTATVAGLAKAYGPLYGPKPKRPGRPTPEPAGKPPKEHTITLTLKQFQQVDKYKAKLAELFPRAKGSIASLLVQAARQVYMEEVGND